MGLSAVTGFCSAGTYAARDLLVLVPLKVSPVAEHVDELKGVATSDEYVSDNVAPVVQPRKSHSWIVPAQLEAPVTG